MLTGGLILKSSLVFHSYELFQHKPVLEADCKQGLENWADFDLAVEHNSGNICRRYGTLCHGQASWNSEPVRGSRQAGMSTSKCLQDWVVGGPNLFAVLTKIWDLLWSELVPLGKVGVTCQDMKDN